MEPIERHDTLADMAYARLRSALMSGTFRPGDTLSIRQLAGVLGISATPARDAISRVLWERGLESGPHRTILVPVLDEDSLREIYDLRLRLETFATHEAASRLGAKAMRKIEQAQQAHRRAVEEADYKAALAANEAFHFTIYDASGNATLSEVIKGLWLKLGPSMNLLYPRYDHSRLGISHHEEVVAALRMRDPVAATRAIEADLRDGWAELARGLAAAAEGRAEAAG